MKEKDENGRGGGGGGKREWKKIKGKEKRGRKYNECNHIICISLIELSSKTTLVLYFYWCYCSRRLRVPPLWRVFAEQKTEKTRRRMKRKK